jgi:Taurine catabolism dioxygenase TauD, TfdA family
MILNFAREPLIGLEGVRRKAGLPTLSQAQRDALDVIEDAATQSQITIHAERGDLLFINNHAILHSREAFEDAPGTGRYLLRMWLKHPMLAWKLPRALQDGNSRIYDENELGERWNIVDEPRLRFRLS